MTAIENSTETTAAETRVATPLADALIAARAELAAATAAKEELYDDDSIAVDDAVYVAACAREELAEKAVEQALDAFIGSDEVCEWKLTEEGQEYGSVLAATAEEALEEARSNVDRSYYEGAIGTIWIDVSVRCVLTGEKASDTVQLDEDEPDCSHDDGHEWGAPHSIVGGIKENPGCWGHGGGVVCHEVCLRCGCGRKTDTWAQRPDTGEQGFTVVTHEEGEYAEQVAERHAKLLDDVRAEAVSDVGENVAEGADPARACDWGDADDASWDASELRRRATRYGLTQEARDAYKDAWGAECDRLAAERAEVV